MTVHTRLEIWLLGGFGVAVDGRPVPERSWRHRKPAALVKLLALEPTHRLHREQVFDALWPDLDPDAAGNNLRFTLHSARRVLAANGDAAPVLDRQGESLVLGPPGALWVDVDAFEAAVAAGWRGADPAPAEEAVALYAGDLLPDDPYEDWVAGRRAALRASYLTLLVRLAELHERRGDLGRAIATAQRLVAAEPVDEAGHVLLMRLYALAGRRRQALAQYDRLVEVLKREIGTEPEAATRDLRDEIATGRFSAHLRSLEPAASEFDAAASTLAPLPLPAPPTDLIGREREVAELGRLLDRSRLVTLTGPGGIGKTRLALAVAHAAATRFADGAVFVDLVPVRDPELVLSTIAQTLGVQETGGHSLPTALRLALKDRRLLLVLDNFEQVAAAAPAVGDLLANCPTARLLITSRVRLRLRGEQEYPLRPLVLPDRGSFPVAEVLFQYAAVALFIQRAREARPDFRVTNETAPAVAEICARLDGLPLAIELAAARTRVLPPSALLARLDRPLSLLIGGPRDLPARQQTLRGTIAWSYNLLAADEQDIFRRLAVFVGGFSLEAAEAVADGTEGRPSVLDTIESLIDNSLILDQSQSRAGTEPRYGMLETIREFGLEALAAGGEAEAARAAHAEYFARLGDLAGDEVFGQPPAFVDRLERESGNLRTALGWAAERGAVGTGLRLTHAFTILARGRGLLAEDRGWLEHFLAIEAEVAPSLRARAWTALAWAALFQRDDQLMTAAANEAVVLSADGDPMTRARALDIQGLVVMEGGDFDRGRALLEAALACCRDLDGGRAFAGFVLANLGLLADVEGNFGEAVARYGEALTLLGPEDEVHRHLVLGNLASTVRKQGDHRRSARLDRQALLLARRTRTAYLTAGTLWAAADHALDAGRPDRAARLMGAWTRLQERTGYAVEKINAPELEQILAGIRAGLDEAAVAAAWAAGEAMTLEEALTEASAAVEVAAGGADDEPE